MSTQVIKTGTKITVRDCYDANVIYTITDFNADNNTYILLAISGDETTELKLTPEVIDELISAEQEQIRTELEMLKSTEKRHLTDIVQGLFGESWEREAWECSELDRDEASFSVLNPYNESRKYCFGHTITIRRWKPFEGGEEWRTSIESLGEFNIDANIPGDSMFFYIGVGKLLSDFATIEKIKNAVLSFNNRQAALGKRYEKIVVNQ